MVLVAWRQHARKEGDVLPKVREALPEAEWTALPATAAAGQASKKETRGDEVRRPRVYTRPPQTHDVTGDLGVRATGGMGGFLLT